MFNFTITREVYKDGKNVTCTIKVVNDEDLSDDVLITDKGTFSDTKIIISDTWVGLHNKEEIILDIAKLEIDMLRSNIAEFKKEDVCEIIEY